MKAGEHLILKQGVAASEFPNVGSTDLLVWIILYYGGLTYAL